MTGDLVAPLCGPPGASEMGYDHPMESRRFGSSLALGVFILVIAGCSSHSTGGGGGGGGGSGTGASSVADAGAPSGGGGQGGRSATGTGGDGGGSGPAGGRGASGGELGGAAGLAGVGGALGWGGGGGGGGGAVGGAAGGHGGLANGGAGGRDAGTGGSAGACGVCPHPTDSCIPDCGLCCPRGALCVCPSNPPGDGGIPASGCRPACATGSICVSSVTNGGAVIFENDAGACGPGLHPSGVSGFCARDPIYGCATTPAACGTTITCACAGTLCVSPSTCTGASAGEVDCQKNVP
jgi:hypothetical protein